MNTKPDPAEAAAETQGSGPEDNKTPEEAKKPAEDARAEGAEPTPVKDAAVETDEPTPAETADESAPAEEAASESGDETATDPPAPAEVQAESTSVDTTPADVTMDAAAPEPSGEDEASSDTTDAADTAKQVSESVESDTRLEHKLRKGQRVEVKLIQVNDKDAFLDWGGPSEGTIASAELKNEKGELRVNEGESFTAIVREVGDTVVFTVGRSRGGDLLRMRELESAHEGKIPVLGKVRSTNKGGFEVDLQGVRAFCPFSQIDTIYCDDPQVHVGKEYPFLIITFERGGRNIVVSRRGIIETEQKEKAKETRETLEVGAVLTGTVRRLQPYGAFVDIGGLDGLVHVSEISRAHISSPKDVLKVGQSVEVKVVGLDALGTRKERVSLSIKALAPDPWEGAAETWKVGEKVHGKVVRLTDFGAFVELAPGVDGLIHVSQISPERIGHPSEVLSPGEEVEVRVLDLDPESKRISLTLRPEGEDAGPSDRGGGRGPRRPRSGRGPTEYSSTPESDPTEPVDVSDMKYDDALAELKKKFEQ
jgi:small subunit ribosomal protein S1